MQPSLPKNAVCWTVRASRTAILWSLSQYLKSKFSELAGEIYFLFLNTPILIRAKTCLAFYRFQLLRFVRIALNWSLLQKIFVRWSLIETVNFSVLHGMIQAWVDLVYYYNWQNCTEISAHPVFPMSVFLIAVATFNLLTTLFFLITGFPTSISVEYPALSILDNWTNPPDLLQQSENKK